MLRALTVLIGSIGWLVGALASGQTIAPAWSPVRAPVWTPHRISESTRYRTNDPSIPRLAQGTAPISVGPSMTGFSGQPVPVAQPTMPGSASVLASPHPAVSPTAIDIAPEGAAFPVMIGDLLGSAFIATLTVEHGFHTTGTIIAGSPGSANSLLAFERDGLGFANDFTSIPTTGRDATGDGNADTFAMTEPLPPNEVPTSPGPGFSYDGGTVVYTNSPSSTTAQNGVYQDGQLWYAGYSFSQTIELPAGGGIAVRRAKVAENNSPFPADRLYFDYKFFGDAPGGLGDVHRPALGFEKTFNRGLGSIDIRIPYAYTLESEQFAEETAMRGMEFGNLALFFKHVIFVNDFTLLSGGAGVSLPTGNDTRLSLADGTPILVIENEAVHLHPFFAAFWTPNERLFLQSFLEVNLDVTGNPVRADIDGGRLPTIGKMRDATLLLADVGGGFWLYQNCSVRDVPIVRGISALGELHYTTTLQDTDIVSGNGITISDRARRFDVLNATAGLHGVFFDRLTLTGGLSLPLRRGGDQPFDLEAAFLANWYF